MNKLLSILFSFVLAVSLQAQPHSTYLAQMQVLKERFGVPVRDKLSQLPDQFLDLIFRDCAFFHCRTPFRKDIR